MQDTRRCQQVFLAHDVRVMVIQLLQVTHKCTFLKRFKYAGRPRFEDLDPSYNESEAGEMAYGLQSLLGSGMAGLSVFLTGCKFFGR